MINNIKKFKRENSREVSDLIIKTFKEFNGEDSTKEGIKFFTEMYKKENIEEKWLKDYVIIAKINNKIIGVGRAKKGGWITHCYVDKEYMGKGIGSNLMNELENWIKLTKDDKILLNSSPSALQFYKKRGYKPAGNKLLYHGIPLYPMVKKLN